MNLSENLKKIRKDNSLSQEQLADMLGVSRQSVSKWESGGAYPEMDKMLKLCEIFNLNIDELLNKDIKEVKSEAQSKNNINKFVDDFLGYVTKVVNLFSSMNFKQKMKCIFEQIAIIFVLIICFAIVETLLSEFVSNLYYLFPGNSYNAFEHILYGIYGIVAVILGVILFLHIFKIRYLDYFVICDKPLEELNNSKDSKALDEKEMYFDRREKVIIRDPEHSGTKFISGLIKFFLIIIKIFAFFIALDFCFSLVCLVIGLIVSFMVVKTGMLFLGILLAVLAAIAINLIVLIILYNFILSKKNKSKFLGISFLISLIMVGIGFGFIFISIKDFDVVSTDSSKYFITDKYDVQMADDLLIQGYPTVHYIESYDENLKVEVKHSEYIKVEMNQDNNLLHFRDIPIYDNAMELFRYELEAFNDKKIVDYSDIRIDIYTTKENIEKLKQNEENQY